MGVAGAERQVGRTRVPRSGQHPDVARRWCQGLSLVALQPRRRRFHTSSMLRSAPRPQFRRQPAPLRQPVLTRRMSGAQRDGQSRRAVKDSVTSRLQRQRKLAGENGRAKVVINSNNGTIWQTGWIGTNDPLPHEIQFDFGADCHVSGFGCLLRQAGDKKSTIGRYGFYVSTDRANGGPPAVAAAFPKSRALHDGRFAAVQGRFVIPPLTGDGTLQNQKA